jgi:hypothetical protein
MDVAKRPAVAPQKALYYMEYARYCSSQSKVLILIPINGKIWIRPMGSPEYMPRIPLDFIIWEVYYIIEAFFYVLIVRYVFVTSIG